MRKVEDGGKEEGKTKLISDGQRYDNRMRE